MSAPTPIWIPSAPGLIEQPESGQIKFAEVATLTKVYKGKYADCWAAVLPKGTVGSSGVTTGLIVQTSDVTPERGGVAKLTIVWGGLSSTGGGGGGPIVPADEFSIDPFELNPNVERHPEFRELFAVDDQQILVPNTLVPPLDNTIRLADLHGYITDDRFNQPGRIGGLDCDAAIFQHAGGLCESEWLGIGPICWAH